MHFACMLALLEMGLVSKHCPHDLLWSYTARVRCGWVQVREWAESRALPAAMLRELQSYYTDKLLHRSDLNFESEVRPWRCPRNAPPPWRTIMTATMARDPQLQLVPCCAQCRGPAGRGLQEGWGLVSMGAPCYLLPSVPLEGWHALAHPSAA